MAKPYQYPAWHLRFLDARNKLGQASVEMEQAEYCADGENIAKFRKLKDAMTALLKRVDTQLMRNYKIGHKEGWLPK